MSTETWILLAKVTFSILMVVSVIGCANVIRKNGNTGTIVLLSGFALSFFMLLMLLSMPAIQLLVNGVDRIFPVVVLALMISVAQVLIGYSLSLKFVVKEAKAKAVAERKPM